MPFRGIIDFALHSIFNAIYVQATYYFLAKAGDCMAEMYEKKLTSKEIFKGNVISLTLDEIELQNGNQSLREVVHHNGGACVVAVNDNCEIALVRQYRYAVGKVLTEIPAGKIEIGEDPLNTAARELEEEAGVTAKKIVPFGQVLPTCAYCTEIIYIYLATGLSQTQQNLDPDEFVDVFWLPLEKAAEMVMNGEIDDSKSAVGILKAWQLHKNNTLL